MDRTATFDTPIFKQAIAEQVAQRVLSMVQDSTLKPGDRLPSERDLAARLEVGRPSLREALRALSLLGVLDIRQGDGIYVSKLSPERLLQPLHFLVSLEADNLDMLFEARAVFEAGLARLAAERLTDIELGTLERYVEEGKGALDTPEVFLEKDIAFHKVITEAAGNPFLEQIVQSLSMLTKASRGITVNLPGMRERSHADHGAIYKALRSRNPELAAKAMVQHLQNVRAAYHKWKEGTQ